MHWIFWHDIVFLKNIDCFTFSYYFFCFVDLSRLKSQNLVACNSLLLAIIHKNQVKDKVRFCTRINSRNERLSFDCSIVVTHLQI